jgi:hypothetical protein
MTWILCILSVSSVLLEIDFSFSKRKRKRKEGIKELKQKPHAIILTWSYLSSMTKLF